MSNNDIQPQAPDKSALKMKLLRRIFVFILVLFLIPIPLIPLLWSAETSSEYGMNTFFFSIIFATVASVALIAIALLSIGPVVMELLDIRKKEKEEKEDMGMFP
jgi:hypothetical protein